MRRYGTFIFLGAAAFCGLAALCAAAEAAADVAARVPPRGALATTWQAAFDRMVPYAGKSLAQGCDLADGGVFTGYQGWFTADGDGTGRFFQHWGAATPNGYRFDSDHATVDLWPDMSELSADERYPTALRHKNGATAEVFSAYHPETVRRHFRWMREYGIRGAFLQRFLVGLRTPDGLDLTNAVLENVRRGAHENNVAWAIMYDLSGAQAGEVARVKEDFKRLCDRMKIREDATYLKYRGRPLVAVWGVGFNDNRAYTTDECREIVEFLKHDSVYGGNAVMLGVPYYWREGKNDALDAKTLLPIIAEADVVSPWAVGRFGGSKTVANVVKQNVAPDIAATRKRGQFYLPVAFPGFSWRNMMKMQALYRGGAGDSTPIPRERGKFLKAQFAELAKAGASAVYVAMFDEVDEGTAIFKCTPNPPVSKTLTFSDNEGVPPDTYLKLCRDAARSTFKAK